MVVNKKYNRLKFISFCFLCSCLVVLITRYIYAANIEAKLDTADGTSNLNIQDSAGTSVATIDSDGNIVASGDLTVSGDDITMTTNTSGAILVADGTNFNPATMSGDCTVSTTGVMDCSTASTASGWTDAGTAVHTTTSTDNVGIGTSTPSTKLHLLSGEATISSTTVNAASGIAVVNTTYSPLAITDTVGNSHSVYKGTLAPTGAISGSGEPVAIVYETSITPNTSDTSDAAYAGLSINYAGVLGSGIKTGILFQGTDIDHEIISLNDLNFSNAATAAQLVTIKTTGNVGIGTTNPAQLLEVNGDVKITGDDLFMTTNTSGAILVADGTNFNPATMSGDCTVSTTGVMDCSGGVVSTAWDDITNPDNNGTKTITFDNAAETTTFSFTGDFGDVDAFRIETATGNPTDGALLVIDASDGDVDAIHVEVGNVGIGITNPRGILDVQNASTLNAFFASGGGAEVHHQRFSADVGAPNWIFDKSRNATINAHTIVQDGDALGIIDFVGSDGVDFSDNNIFNIAARIAAQVDGTPGASADMPGELIFATSAEGSITPTSRMIIRSDGNVGIGTTGPAKLLEVLGATTGEVRVSNSGAATSKIQLLSNNTGSDDDLGSLEGIWSSNIVSRIIFNAGDDTTNKDDGYISFDTVTAGNGTVTTERMRIEQDGNVGIGLTAPNNILDIGANSSGPLVDIELYHTGGQASGGQEFISFNRSRSGDVGSHLPVGDNDVLGGIRFQGSDGTNFVTAIRIQGLVDGTPGSNDMPGRLSFQTTPDGSSAPAIAMVIRENGNVGIGLTSGVPDAILAVQNDADTASNKVVQFEGGDRTTPADNDEAYISLLLEDSGGSQDEFGRLSWVAAEVDDGSEEALMTLDLMDAGSLSELMRIGHTGGHIILGPGGMGAFGLTNVGNTRIFEIFNVSTTSTPGDIIVRSNLNADMYFAVATGTSREYIRLDHGTTTFVVNENGSTADTGQVDFRVETDGEPNALFTDSSADNVQINAAFGVAGVQTFTDSDTTPDVSGKSYFNTNTTGVTITDFDGSSIFAGQIIYVVSKGAIVYDVDGTPGNLKGGTTNITTASGDLTVWFYDGTDWILVSFTDQSDDLS